MTFVQEKGQKGNTARVDEVHRTSFLGLCNCFMNQQKKCRHLSSHAKAPPLTTSHVKASNRFCVPISQVASTSSCVFAETSHTPSMSSAMKSTVRFLWAEEPHCYLHLQGYLNELAGTHLLQNRHIFVAHRGICDPMEREKARETDLHSNRPQCFVRPWTGLEWLYENLSNLQLQP